MSRNGILVPAWLRFLVAWCLACYAMTVVYVQPGEEEDVLGWVALAPVTVPGTLLFVVYLVGNPELPADTGKLGLALLVFSVLLASSWWLVRRFGHTRRFYLTAAGLVLLYLGITCVIQELPS